MSTYAKIYIRGGAMKKQTTFGEVVEVFINVDDLMAKIKSGEAKPTATGNINFSIMKKKPESIKPWEADHYLVHSYKIDDWPAKQDPFASTSDERFIGPTTPVATTPTTPAKAPEDDDDLPF